MDAPKRWQKHVLILGTLACLLMPGSLQAETLFKAQVEKNLVKLGENINLKVLLLQESNQGALGVTQASQPEMPEMPDWVIRNQSSSQNISVVQNNMRMLMHFDYVLSPRKAGKLTIPALTYTVQENGQERQLKTNPIELTVIDPAQEQRWKLTVFVALFFLLLALGYATFRWLPARLKHAVLPPPRPKENPHVLQLQQWQAYLHEQPLPENLIEQFQNLVYEVVDSRYGLNCIPLTHQEILAQLEFHPRMLPPHWQILEAVLTALNSFRYRPDPPSLAEWETVLSQMSELVSKLSGSGSLRL